MGGISGNWKPKMQELQKSLKGLQSSAFKATLYRQLSREALTQVTMSFDRERDPYGRMWVPSLRAIKQGGKTLSNSGRLRNSFRAGSSSRSFSISSSVVYAAIQNYGGSVTHGPGVRAHNADTGAFLRKSSRTTAQPENQLQGRRATRVSFAKAYSAHLVGRPFLPRNGDLGPVWTPAFWSVATAVFESRLGIRLGAS